MNDEETEKPLPLLQGVICWCDQKLIAKIIEMERPFSFVDLERDSWPQLSQENERQLHDCGLRDRRAGFLESRHAYWAALERDLKARLADEQLHLEGVPVTQDMNQAAQAIRGALAAEFQFDFRMNSLRFKQQKFVSVTLSPAPSPWAPLEIGTTRLSRAAPTLKVCDLSTDQILELIEEHARRVIEDPEAKLMPPGKVSLIPLIRMKMQERARHDALEPTLNGETAWLAKWIADKAEHWDTPKAATIARSLGTTYAMLKARSNAAI